MSKTNLVIFGGGDMAELAYYYFRNDSEYNVVALTLDAEFIQNETEFGLPVVPFESVQEIYPPEENVFFVALSYSKINKLRKDKYLAAKSKGYEIASYVSSRATIMNDGDIGENCFILEDNTIQPFVSIGDNVTLWSGNHIGHHSSIGAHSFIASHIVVSGGVTVGQQCFIGVNATLRDHIEIGDRSVIGAGALILESTEPDSLYVGARTAAKQRKSSTLKKI